MNYVGQQILLRRVKAAEKSNVHQFDDSSICNPSGVTKERNDVKRGMLGDVARRAEKRPDIKKDRDP